MKNLALLSILVVAGTAKADMTFHSLAGGDFSQDWSNTGLITANDDWSGVLSIMGYLGDTNAGSPTGVDPTTYLAASLGAVDVIANQTNPNTLTSGGVAEFESSPNSPFSPTIALNGSGTADTPGIVLFMNAAGRSNVTLGFDLIDLDGSADNSIQQIAVQYRIGGVGDFVNATGGYVADATAGPSLFGLTTPMLLTDAAWDNASSLEFRIITTNAAGNDEWVGIDNIRVTSQAVPEPATMLALGAGLAAFAARRRRK
ncbi:MAG: PEP-CTERM sorting domain-containing protein [Fimbriimonadaceae bacterium]|nr:PEP-CTERM sorting domain-containing protein [Fimbriimonadaceae bacterium]